MSLNWSLPGKTDRELAALHKQGLIQAAVFLSMSTGIPVLTEATLPVAMARCRALEVLSGPFWRSATDKGLADFLPQLLGLRTNVSKVSDAKWWKMHAAAATGAEMDRLHHRAQSRAD
jgi:hypothetical protein